MTYMAVCAIRALSVDKTAGFVLLYSTYLYVLPKCYR